MGEIAAGIAVVIALAGGLFFLMALPVALISLGMEYRRTRRSGRALLIGLMMAAGFLAGCIATWFLLPAEWNLSFGKTLQASVDSETYGHPVEHAAENILVAMLFFAVAGGVTCGLAEAMITRLRSLSEQRPTSFHQSLSHRSTRRTLPRRRVTSLCSSGSQT
jgi:hypothetical protein